MSGASVPSSCTITGVSAIEERFPRPSVMGVVNVTPDAFSDGGVHLDPDVAAGAARRMAAEGAAIVDIGGESTRPGSGGVAAGEELRRVVPVLERLAGEVPISIDTAKAEVARRALELGAELVNDVTALRADPVLVGFSRKSSLGKVLGDPAATTGPLSASIAAAVACYEHGATILRAHDVREHVEALAVARALAGA